MNRKRTRRSWAGLSIITALVIFACLTVSSSGQPGTGTTPSPDVISDNFAVCVNDGTCAGGLNSPCPGGMQGASCEMCQFQLSRQKCVFAWTQNCLWWELGGTPAGCGTRWVGTCVVGGGGITICVGNLPDGSCSRISCVSGPIL